MFKWLASKLAEANRGFDPSIFGDPVAMQAEWTPAKRGGANFRTHKLVQLYQDRLEFHATAGAKAFYLIFLLVGLGLFVGISVHGLTRNASIGPEIIVPGLLGLVFACVGAGLFHFGTIPIVMDRRKGYFWRGRHAPDEVFDSRTLKHWAKLEDIHALQLIRERCHSSNGRRGSSSYYSYELNLVLKDGRRINVVDHGNIRALISDAEAISKFLNCPIWDATGQTR